MKRAATIILFCCVVLTGCGITGSWISDLSLVDTTRRMRDVELESPVDREVPVEWTREGQALIQIDETSFLDTTTQEVLTLSCGHLRRWLRPGINLELVEPLLNDPFKLANPNQLVASQTWFWKVRVSGEPRIRLAQSRFERLVRKDGSTLTRETWVIDSLRFSSINEYVMGRDGELLSLSIHLHPALPRVTLVSPRGFQCDE